MNAGTDLRPKTILLVEDNVDEVALTRRALKKADIMNEVAVASDGEEALNYCLGPGRDPGREPEPLPHVVFLDLHLPRVGGLEVLKRIRQDPRTRHLPVVIFTSSREERDLVAGYNSGCNSYICKPVDFQEFAEAVRLAGVYWLRLNEVPSSL